MTFRHLRLVACGGSAVPLSLMQTFEQQHGVYIQQAWGMTETSPLATVAKPLPGATEDRHWAMRTTQGRPMCGVEVRVVDDAGDQLPADGKSVGELEVRGPWITGGYYLGRDAEKFDGGWLRTGDVGRIDPEGFVTLTDRAKDVIKSGGEWISSVELENHLIGHPGVLEAAVVGVPDERWQERPLAVVVLEEGVAHARRAARVPGRQGGSLVATGAVDLRRAGSAHQRRQVRQEDHPRPARRGRVRDHHAVIAGAWPV